MAQDVKLVAIAIADNQGRVDDFKAKFKVSFPIFPDEKWQIYHALKEPVVPSILLTTTGGKVLLRHNGLIKDFDGLAKMIREIHQKQ